MSWLSRLFREKEVIVEVIKEIPIVPTPSPWVEFSKQKPPHEVVLAACDTYDCGWTMDTAWWNKEKQCWMAGPTGTEEAHLPYTHWRKLPDFPNEVK